MRSKYLWGLLLLTGLTIWGLSAQTSRVASWEITGSTEGKETALRFTVDLEEGWYIYAPDQDPDLGPVPTSVIFEKSDAFTPVGMPKPFRVKEKYDEVWEGTVRIIEESGGGFTQTLQVLKANPVIRGRIIYTVCSEKTGQCLFPEKEFELTLTTKNH